MNKKLRFRVAHCNICGAVIAVKFYDTEFSTEDPMIIQHKQYHEALRYRYSSRKEFKNE